MSMVVPVAKEMKHAPDPGAKPGHGADPPRNAADHPSDLRDLSDSIIVAAKSIDLQLARWVWAFPDPERRKALSRARDFMQRIQECIEEQWHQAPRHLPIRATKELIDRAGEKGSRSGRENAWDFAEELRVASWAFLPDEGLASLLERERLDATKVSWASVFGRTELERLLETPRPGDFRVAALGYLRRLHHERVDRVRHDRARDKLWQSFVWKLIPIVYGLFFLCLLTTREPPFPAVAAGAIGAMLSGVFKLRDGEQRIRDLRRSSSFLLLQPMIGATAALVMMWLGASSVLTIKSPHIDATLGFLAGFSEPFFLGTIARLADAASSGKSKSTESDIGQKKVSS